jgi:hypothetical protein
MILPQEVDPAPQVADLSLNEPVNPSLRLGTSFECGNATLDRRRLGRLFSFRR